MTTQKERGEKMKSLDIHLSLQVFLYSVSIMLSLFNVIDNGDKLNIFKHLLFFSCNIISPTFINNILNLKLQLGKAVLQLTHIHLSDSRIV